MVEALQPDSIPTVMPFPELREHNLLACVIGRNENDRIRAFQALRHGYFVRERKWVTENAERPGEEADRYDGHCLHLGVFREERLLAYLRMLPWIPEVGFMLDHEFKALLSEQDRISLPREGSAEVSRLVVSGENGFFAGPQEKRQALELLFKLLYRLSLARGYRRLYVEVETGWLAAFRRTFRLPFEPIGRPCRFPDGTETAAACADLADLEDYLRQRAPERLEWYRTG